MTPPPTPGTPGTHGTPGLDDPARLAQRVAVYGICEDGAGKVLLVRAAPYLTVAGSWFLPGGGIDHGEPPVAALEREFAEETGLTVEVGDLRGVLSDTIALPDGRDLHTVRIVYGVRSFSGSLRDEADGSTDTARWLGVDEALGMPLMPYVRRALTELR